MIDFDLRFHHLGLAVRQKSAAVKFLRGMGYQIGETLYDPNQLVNLIMCTSDSQPDVEIIYPSEDTGPVDNILKSNNALIYHTCYLSKDIDGSIHQIKEAGIRVLPISDKKPAPLFDNRKVAFFYIDGFGLVELLEGNYE
jgi:Glyoxalase/Bleomycin resistance protein/Dioxygenase superfamily